MVCLWSDSTKQNQFQTSNDTTFWGVSLLPPGPLSCLPSCLERRGRGSAHYGSQRGALAADSTIENWYSLKTNRSKLQIQMNRLNQFIAQPGLNCFFSPVSKRIPLGRCCHLQKSWNGLLWLRIQKRKTFLLCCVTTERENAWSPATGAPLNNSLYQDGI